MLNVGHYWRFSQIQIVALSVFGLLGLVLLVWGFLFGVRPLGVRPLGVRPLGVRPLGVRPLGVRPFRPELTLLAGLAALFGSSSLIPYLSTMELGRPMVLLVGLILAVPLAAFALGSLRSSP